MSNNEPFETTSKSVHGKPSATDNWKPFIYYCYPCEYGTYDLNDWLQHNRSKEHNDNLVKFMREMIVEEMTKKC